MNYHLIGKKYFNDKDLLDLKRVQNHIDKNIITWKKLYGTELIVPNKNKCQSRVWNSGYGGQCSHDKLTTGCLCSFHKQAEDKHKTWWLGNITDTKPSSPKHYNGDTHYWN